MSDNDFVVDQFVVYPSHGVGKITAIEEQEIAGISMELFVIDFAKDKMTLRVPTAKATSVVCGVWLALSWCLKQCQR